MTSSKKEKKSKKAEAEEPAAESIVVEEPQPTAEDWQDKFLRAQADLQNMRRRLGEETEERVRMRLEAILHDLIRVADFMEAALGAIPEPVREAEQSEAFLAGIRAIQQALEGVMMGHGMVFLAPTAETEYNPEEHEAVETEIDDSLEKTRLELVSRGYRIGKRILRPAKVKLVRPQEPEEAAPDAAE